MAVTTGFRNAVLAALGEKKFISSDVSVTSGTLVDLTGLTGFTLEADYVYRVTAGFQITGVGTTDDIGLGINASQTPQIIGIAATGGDPNTNTTTAPLHASVGIVANNTKVTYVATTTNTYGIALIGTIHAHATTAGTLAFRGAVTSGGITFKAGSWAMLERLGTA